MTNKKVFIGTIIFFVIVVIGIIPINIINTKALSPIGNGNDNYELVKEEFGKDFEEFIKDDAEIKIYTESEERVDTTIKVYDKEFIINTNNKFTETFYNLGEFLYNGFDSIVDKINNSTNNKEEDKDEKKNNEELDKIINDFLEDKKISD